MAEINQFEEQKGIQEAISDTEEQHELRKVSVDTVTVNEQYEEIRQYRHLTEKKINDIDQLFRKLMSEVISYKEEVKRALHEPFFKELAILMSDMEYSNDVYASRLEHILCTTGMELIAPKAGEKFDITLHERENRNETGTVITGCITKGWKLGECVLLRSIVSTANDEEDEHHE